MPLSEGPRWAVLSFRCCLFLGQGERLMSFARHFAFSGPDPLDLLTPPPRARCGAATYRGIWTLLDRIPKSFPVSAGRLPTIVSDRRARHSLTLPPKARKLRSSRAETPRFAMAAAYLKPSRAALRSGANATSRRSRHHRDACRCANRARHLGVIFARSRCPGHLNAWGLIELRSACRHRRTS